MQRDVTGEPDLDGAPAQGPPSLAHWLPVGRGIAPPAALGEHAVADRSLPWRALEAKRERLYAHQLGHIHADMAVCGAFGHVAEVRQVACSDNGGA